MRDLINPVNAFVLLLYMNSELQIAFLVPFQIELPFFSSGAENVERVLVTVIQGAVEYPDPIAQKTCFIILSKLVELWGKIILFKKILGLPLVSQ